MDFFSGGKHLRKKNDFSAVYSLYAVMGHVF